MENRPPHPKTESAAENRADDSVAERSAELLRLALPMMSRHGDGYHPVSYAVWYEYVAGANEELKQAVDEMLKTGARLSAQQTMDVHRRHLVERTESAVAQAQSGLLGVLEKVQTSVAEVSAGAARFDADLRHFGQRLSGAEDESAVNGDVQGMLEKARHMGSSLGLLQGEFDRSQDEVERLSQELSRIRQEALTDPLTALTNRRGFDAALAAQCEQALAQHTPLALLMLDIDWFKRVNDAYGHLTGDQVIRSVAEVIRAQVKGQDVAARFGGDEFAVLLPRTTASGAKALAENIRMIIQGSRIRTLTRRKPISHVTVSIGVAVWRPKMSAQRLVELADAALYQAKTGGRNRVMLPADAH
jgi:diguanylate cyclase